ncbi:MAG: monovalent cation/H+ antiporter complex subunit F [Candidatus Bipolaricaulaceae bacterium]
MKTWVEVGILASALPPLVRLWRGPTLWDRLAGAGAINVRIALLLAAEAPLSGQSLLLDVALAYAALSFLGVVLVARFGERGER